MPKATGPLFSMSASGTLGKTITFDKRGFVRQRVVPSNPKSEAQGNVRQMLLATQRALTLLGATVIASVRTIAPTAYRWNSFMLQQVIGSNSSEFEAARTAFLALTAPQRADWDTAATTAGLTTQAVIYASDDDITPGLALFAVSRALFRLGIGVDNGEPGAANADEWGAFYVS